jgi:hypothetical protein
MAATFRRNPEPYRTRLTGRLAINFPKVEKYFTFEEGDAIPFLRAFLNLSLNLTAYEWETGLPFAGDPVPLTPIWSHAIPKAH